MNDARQSLSEDELIYLRREIANIKESIVKSDPSDLARPIRRLQEKMLQFPGCIPLDRRCR